LSDTQPRALGILGGTFDPIHDAHLAIAQAALEALDLETVLFVPAGMPPHKRDRVVTPPRHRVAMTELGVSGNLAFRVSRIELERAGPSYAVDTVEAIAHTSAADGRPAPVFIGSVETLRGLITWREPQRLLSLCRLAVAPRCGHRRPGHEWLAEHFPGLESRVVFLDGPELGHSASDIRARVASGRSIRYLVPPAVDAYITRNRLYPPDLWNKN
jgi:nicotinate-nucleotide adenylyltransferase